MPQLTFEPLESNQGNFFRAKVPGGWLIMSEQDVMHNEPNYGRDGFRSGFDWRTSVTFVPDPTHEWKVD